MCNTTCKPLVRDERTGRYTRATVAELKLAQAQIELQIAQEGQAALNDLYDQLLLEPVPDGHELGWTHQRGIGRLQLGLAWGPNEEPAVSFEFEIAPYNMEEAR